MIKIYKLTKTSNPMTVYIGQTEQTLNSRLCLHARTAKYKPHIKLSQWFDNTCQIVWIQDFIGDEISANIREMEIVHEYIANGYEVVNTKLGEYILDPVGCRKKLGKKHNPITNANKNSDYNNWCSRICRDAKKEGLTSKQYREKYNIPDYSGQKKKKR